MFKLWLSLFVILCLFVAKGEAAYGFVNGKVINKRYIATKSVQEHYQLGVEAIDSKNWNEAINQFQIIFHSFPESRFAIESLYYISVAYFNTADYDMANQKLSLYLQLQSHPKHFYEALQYKYAIAEQFSMGARRHLFGMEALPKVLTSKELALSIFDEIIAALPNDELAAKSLYAKGQLLYSMKEYSESIEAFSAVIKRFPKNALAPDSYLAISYSYFCQGLKQANDPDLLGLAQINIKRFRSEFPGDERIAEAEEQYHAMLENSARVYLDMGFYYERTHHPAASVLYYLTTINQFPKTHAADEARRRLDLLRDRCPGLNIPNTS